MISRLQHNVCPKCDSCQHTSHGGRQDIEICQSVWPNPGIALRLFVFYGRLKDMMEYIMSQRKSTRRYIWENIFVIFYKTIYLQKITVMERWAEKCINMTLFVLIFRVKPPSEQQPQSMTDGVVSCLLYSAFESWFQLMAAVLQNSSAPLPGNITTLESRFHHTWERLRCKLHPACTRHTSGRFPPNQVQLCPRMPGWLVLSEAFHETHYIESYRVSKN